MSRNPTPGFRRLPRVADRMTAAHFDLVAQSLAAERSGDAARALELHSRVPALNLRSRHHVLLTQLASLGDHLPDWVWARWIAYQAVRCEDRESDTGQAQRLALKYAIETFHDDQLADCHADGGDPVRVMAWVASESWLFHQVLVHELGGLERFVDEIATGRLAEHAELARSWVGAPLGGYQVGRACPAGALRVHDPAAGSWLEVLDLGARSDAGDDGWVLGRLVPSGVDDLLMFDTPPIAVPEPVARDVAGAPQPWTCIKEALDEGRLVERHFMRADHELVTDVLSIDLLRIGTRCRRPRTGHRAAASRGATRSRGRRSASCGEPSTAAYDSPTRRTSRGRPPAARAGRRAEDARPRGPVRRLGAVGGAGPRARARSAPRPRRGGPGRRMRPVATASRRSG